VFLTSHLIWLSVFLVIPVAKTATESLTLAALTVLLSIGLSRLSRLVSQTDHVLTGIIQIQIENANLAILIVKHASTPQHNAQNVKQSISSKDSVVLISACVVYMETIRHNLVTLTL